MTKTTAPAAATPSTAVTVLERAQLALGTAEHEKKLHELVKHAQGVTAITNAVTYQECHGARMSLKNGRVAIKKAGELAREDANAYAKGVIAEEKRLIAIGQAEEERLQAMQDAWDERVEREKQAKIEAERVRVEALQERVTELRGNQSLTVLTGSIVLGQHIEDLVAIPVDDTFQEFRKQAEEAKAAGLARLRELHAAAVEHEAEKRELARLKAAEEQRIREQAERDAAETRKRAEEDAKRQAAIDQQERESRARIDAENRKAQEQRDEADRVARIAREAEERKLAEERAKIEAARREQEERDREARAEQEERDRAERQRLEAEATAKAEQQRKDREAEEARKREEQRKADELLSARDLLVTFRNRYSALTEFAKVHKAIDVYMTQFNSERKKAA